MSSSWMNNVVGSPPTQYNNALRIGFDNNQYTGNKILPINNKGISGGKKGGLGVLATMATPLTLLALQNQYKGKSRNYRRSSSRRRYGRRRSLSRRARR